MQTFLPYPSFEASAVILDRQRLGKQRVEGMQILLALTGRSGGWRHHPATRMWLGYEAALAKYVLAIAAEWVSRGYTDTVSRSVAAIANEERLDLVNAVMPPWLGDERLHSSHRSNLIRKNQTLYGLAGWSEGPDLKYYWPPESLRKLPERSTTMSDEQNDKAPTRAQTIDMAISEAVAEINPEIGEKNVIRAQKRFAIAQRVLKTAFTRLEAQTKYATRQRREKKVKAAPAQAAVAQ